MRGWMRARIHPFSKPTVVFAELKNDVGKLLISQHDWILTTVRGALGQRWLIGLMHRLGLLKCQFDSKL